MGAGLSPGSQLPPRIGRGSLGRHLFTRHGMLELQTSGVQGYGSKS